MTGLDASQRAALERLIVRARSGLEEDLEAQAEGRYGINSDGTIEDEAALHLDPSALADRREIVAIVEHLRNEGETTTGAVARLIREAAFTHLNRLVAIRVAEAMGLVRPSLADGRASQGFREVLEVAPLVASDESGGYWTYLRLCGDEMAGDAPVLFDPRNPLLTLSPSVAALDELVTLFSDPAAQEIWTASDTFGWAYQFFNTGDERRRMRDESAAPRNSRELAVRNQFFTPRYVVDFLVQNTLGRRLLEAQIDSALIDALPLLVDPPTERSKPLPLENVRILDPACGSGHFLLGCYDLLERAWQLKGVEPADAAPLIVPTLWGIDIDPRCAQVASAAIVFRARRHCRDLLPRPNVITARALPDGSDSWEHLLASLPSDRRELVQRMREALAQANVLGPLLKVEERLAAEIRRHFTGSDVAGGTLAEGIAPDAFGEVESEVLAVLQRAADAAASSAAERLLAAEAGDAIRFVDAIRQRYDVVLMNPPFGEPVPETREYLRSAYRPLDNDLFSAFVGRGLELCGDDGYLGAITSRAGMFLTTFEQWRTQVLLGHQLVTLADFGHGVMEQAMVEAAAYVIRAAEHDPDRPAVFLRLLRVSDRSQGLAKAAAAARAHELNSRVFRVSSSELAVVPGSPVAYWMDPALRKLFTEFPALEGSGAEVRRGSWPGDDFRFVRLWWEPLVGEPGSSARWVPYAKGGSYAPFFSEPHLAVPWDDARSTFRGFSGRRGRPSPTPENVAYYFRPGLTWPRRTQGGFNPSVLPAGCVFADKGPSIFSLGSTEPLLLLAWLTSRPFVVLLDALATFGSYEVGAVQKMPWIGEALDASMAGQIKSEVEAVTSTVAARAEYDETTRRFIAPSLLGSTGAIEDRIGAQLSLQEHRNVEAIDHLGSIEDALLGTLGLGPGAMAYLDEERGPVPSSFGHEPLGDETRFAEAYRSGNPSLIGDAGAARGAGSYLIDPMLEPLSRATERHPSVLAETRERLGLLPPSEPKSSVESLFSYLVGLAFGRWDVRVGRDPSLARPVPGLFEALPVCPPGMLVGSNGLPAQEAPSGYPLALPPARLLLDEPGHAWDIEDAVTKAAAAVFDDADATLAEMLAILGRRSVRDYLRRQFFKIHLAHYSKSRRKAPIYWPLAVPSRSWGVWVYAPTLSRETLFAIAGEAARREALAAEAVRRLQAERETSGSGRSAREVAEALTVEEALAEELRTFRAEADRIAGLGWEPDFDDGIILCAAPLATLFPAWPDAAKEREQIREDDYPWATVSRWKGAL